MLKKPGTVLNDLVVIEGVLGQGGMGAVYRAHHRGLNQAVAVKELRIEEDDPERWRQAVAQFQSEARLLAKLSHPHLTKVIDCFSDGQSHFLVLELVEGQTLDVFVPQPPSFLGEDVVLAWMRQVCDVLDYLHGHQPPVLYRDLKPTNLMVEANNHIRLIDFGIAREALDETRTATFIKGAGSLGFAPPEQYSTGCDGRSDIYSLGATMYALLSGEAPPMGVVRAVEDAIVPLRQRNRSVSARVSAAVMQMLAVNADERPPTITAVRRLLWDPATIIVHSTRPMPLPEPAVDPVRFATTDKAPSAPPRRPWLHTWPGVMLGILAVAAVTVLVVYYWQPSAAAPAPPPVHPVTLAVQPHDAQLFINGAPRPGAADGTWALSDTLPVPIRLVHDGFVPLEAVLTSTAPLQYDLVRVGALQIASDTADQVTINPLQLALPGYPAPATRSQSGSVPHRFDDLAPGHYQCTLEAPGYTSLQQDVEVQSDQTTPLRVELVRSITATGAPATAPPSP